MNFTIGKYYNTDSIINKLDPRCKIFGLLIYIIACFIDRNIYNYLLLGSILAIYIWLSKVSISMLIQTIRPVIVFAIIMSVITLFTTSGIVILDLKILEITKQGVNKSIYVLIRWILIVLACGMFTYTTEPLKIMKGLEKGIGLSANIAMMITIAIRFLPILVEEFNRIKIAQEIRGADFSTSNIFKRIKLNVGLMVPLVNNSIDRASNLAIAMDSRCFTGNKNRSSLYPLKYTKMDYIFYVCLIAFLVAIIVLAVLF